MSRRGVEYGAVVGRWSCKRVRWTGR